MSVIEKIKSESTELEEEARFAAAAHRINSRKWQKWSLYLGIPATILAAVAGVTAFSELPEAVTGFVAILAAALTGISTFLSPSDTATSHRTSSATYNRIRRHANLLRDLDAATVKQDDEASVKELAQTLRDLTNQLSEAEQAAPTLSHASRKQAKEEITSAAV